MWAPIRYADLRMTRSWRPRRTEPRALARRPKATGAGRSGLCTRKGRSLRGLHGPVHTPVDSYVARNRHEMTRMNILCTGEARGRSAPRGTTEPADGPAHADTLRPPRPRRHRGERRAAS